VTQTEKILYCVECQRSIRPNEAKAAGWFYWSDGEDLHLVCALCAAREVAVDAPASTQRP
jgi:hypothetical protein